MDNKPIMRINREGGERRDVVRHSVTFSYKTKAAGMQATRHITNSIDGNHRRVIGVSHAFIYSQKQYNANIAYSQALSSQGEEMPTLRDLFILELKINPPLIINKKNL
ncbi:hypothetical protein L4C36_06605 [Photobacterium japonica]|uniref:hypothetical protein n=1 Tax=Photobacterium japonica TaxID=2910235 RepID=UPI003D0BD049